MRHRFHYKSLFIITIVLGILIVGVIAMPRLANVRYGVIPEKQTEQPVDENDAPMDTPAQEQSSGQPVFTEISTQIGKGASIGGIVVIPKKVVEDSRCPMNARCIQAGFARVQVDLIAGSNAQTVIMTLGDDTSVEIAGKKVRLVSVSPENVAGKTTQPSEYTFVFDVQG